MLSYLQIILTNLISLLYTPYMLRIMGQSEYGIYGTAVSFTSYLVVLNFGVAGAYIRFHAKTRATGDAQAEKQLNGMFLLLFGILAGLVLLAGTGLLFFAEALVKSTYTPQQLWKLRVIIVILTVSTATSFVCNAVMMALQAYEKYIAIRAVLLLCSVITPVANLIVLHLGGRAVSITLITYLINVAAYLFFWLYARRAIGLRFSFRGLQWGKMKPVFAFSGFLFLNAVTEQITFSTDNVILSAVSGPAVAAVYTVGAHFMGYFQNFVSAISFVFTPEINRMAAEQSDRNQMNALFIRVGRLQFYVAALLLIGYASVGQAFVGLWAGENYTTSFYVGLILMLSVFISGIQSVAMEIQKAQNKHKERSVVLFLISLGNVLLTVPFCKWWGPVGAAGATLICMVLGSGFLHICYVKTVQLDMAGFWKAIFRILPGCILPAAVGAAIGFFWPIRTFIGVVLAALVITAVFAGSVWCLSMNSYEKELIRKPLRRLFVKK